MQLLSQNSISKIRIASFALAAGFASFVSGDDEDISREKLRFFENKIRPVLVDKCYSCHSAEAAKNGDLKGQLLLDSKQGILKGGESGRIIDFDQPKTSLLIKALQHDSVEMPPDEKLSDNVIKDFETWILQGTPDPRNEKSINLRSLSLEKGRKYWAFRRLKRPEIPQVQSDWCQNEIDAFVLLQLKSKKMTPAKKADRYTLVRRVYFNLTGLPPTPTQVQSFLKDTNNESNRDTRLSRAVDQLSSKLLSSVEFGEHWGRQWLDVARFGESEGSNPEEDKIRPNAYQYRDAVIRAVYRDMPFDEFIAIQLSAEVKKPEFESEKELAQFIGLGTRLQRNSHPNDKKYHILDDMVSATGSAFLGLTIECARCHDHKIDPITTEEYYRMTAVFFDQAKVGGKVGINNIKVIGEPVLLAGGSWQRPLRKVQPGFVNVLFPDDLVSKSEFNIVSPRHALANWMADVNQGAGGLVARVIVNRIWQFHFGRGIVATPNDFGGLGEQPSHPSLLDWLAAELVENHWSLHHIHKLILNSATFQQASSDQFIAQDQDNRLLWHYRARRLSAEVIRDNILATSGALIKKSFGPSISVGTNRNSYQEKPEHWRRSIYLMNSRFQTHPVLKVYDPPTSFKSQGKRQVSTTPASALFGLNSKFVWQQAEIFAKRVESISEKRKQVRAIYNIALARPPTEIELKLGLKWLSSEAETETSLLVQYCHALLNLNEFIYVR
ncbi:MAG: PSD1 and planctomycete cytochrome C domain-containing protein [Planctomycetota bacterium]|nr:PSD1 and planctomycete cytochrome C domain-containing protein [Planctomycetota bacterium]